MGYELAGAEVQTGIAGESGNAMRKKSAAAKMYAVTSKIW
jgi:hypothetical protein